VGFLGVPPVEDERNVVSVEEVVGAGQSGGARLELMLQLGAHTTVTWKALLVGGALYLRPAHTLPDGSKEAFVALLEYAEEHLKCECIYVCFRKTALPKALVRTFQFLGFSVVAPDDGRAPPSSQFLSLVYTIADDDDDEDDTFDDQ